MTTSRLTVRSSAKKAERHFSSQGFHLSHPLNTLGEQISVFFACLPLQKFHVAGLSPTVVSLPPWSHDLEVQVGSELTSLLFHVLNLNLMVLKD